MLNFYIHEIIMGFILMTREILADTIHYSEGLGLSKVIRALEVLLPAQDVEVTYLCIGSDLSTGDSFGPLTGTLLKRMGVTGVLGSLDDTVHAKNIADKIEQVPENHFVVAIDAIMGRHKELGCITFINGPLHPGAAMKKNLPPVGDVSILFNVAPAGFANFVMLGCVSLNTVWQGANLLARGISVVSYRREKTRTGPRGQALHNCIT